MYSITDLKDIIQKLRDPKKGCPWDKEQTHQSLTPYVIEEAYEVASAIESGDSKLLVDELGDLLLQVVLHAQIASEKQEFNFEDVVNSVSTKMVRRHPHIFSDTDADTVEKVWKNWEKIKAEEGEDAGNVSIMDTVPQAMPALMKSEKVQKKASRLGFDWDKNDDVVAKVEEELQEFMEAETQTDKEEEMGDLFFSLVNLARKNGIHSEEVVRRASDKFVNRFKIVEKKVKASGKEFDQYNLEELDQFWNEAKDSLRNPI